MTALPFHPVANIFPLMSGADFDALKDDIQRNGQLEPIWTHDGQIIDGRNRYRACLDLGIEPQIREWNGDGSLVAFVVSLNLHRRHLDSSQKAVIALEVEKALAVEARANMVQGGEARAQGLQKIENPATHAAEEAARMVGTNRQYVSDAKRIAATAPDVLEVVRNGHVNIPAAKQIAQLPEASRAPILDRLVAGKVKDVKDEVRAARAALPRPTPAPVLLPVPDAVRLDVGNATDLPLADASVDLIITSPPYGLDIDYDQFVDPAESWYELMSQFCAEAYRVAKPGGRLAVNVPLDTTKPSPRPTYAQVIRAATLEGWEYRTTIIWNEGNVSKSVARGSVDSYTAPHIITPVEMIAVFCKGDWRLAADEPPDLNHDEWLAWTNGLWTFPGEGRAWEGHPAPFPEELPRRLVKLLSGPGSTVLDPFVGSGTTPLVAYQLGRRAIGFDLSPAYIESARRRLSLAAQEAVA